MVIKVGINGFGRIGRLFYRAVLESDVKVDVVAVNDLTSAATNAHLLKYDSVHGRLGNEISVGDGGIVVDGRELRVFSEPEPSKIPWGEAGVHTVVECTGRFRTRELSAKHLEAGADKVLISAPARGVDATIVPGVNDGVYDPGEHGVISLASCTTNCLAPMAKVLNDSFGIESGLMTTVHAYTNDQRLLDMQHRDIRRARAAAANIILTTTGAATAVGLVLPELAGRLNGMAMRVPVTNVSVTDLVATVERSTDSDGVNSAYREASEGSLRGFLAYTEEPLVSSDYIHSPYSVTIDGLTTTVAGRLVKVVGWYDNEWGYSNRMAWMVERMGELEGL